MILNIVPVRKNTLSRAIGGHQALKMHSTAVQGLRQIAHFIVLIKSILLDLYEPRVQLYLLIFIRDWYWQPGSRIFGVLHGH